MTYEEAKAIAIVHNRGINACREYKEGYRFYSKDVQTDGGDCDFVVIKATGKCLPITTFIFRYKPSGKGKGIRF